MESGPSPSTPAAGRRRSPARAALAGLVVAAPLVLVGLPAVRAATDRGPGRAGRVAQPAADDVRTIFLRDCAVCHGADARGTRQGPSLVHVGAAAVDYWVSTGRMPLSSPSETPQRHRPRYPQATIRALVAYVSALGGGGPPVPRVDPAAGNVAAGGEQYRLNCAACHAWGGEGGALLRREAPPLRHSTPTQIAEAVRIGPGTMPAFGPAALSDAQVNDVVAYVRHLQHPEDRGGDPLWHLGPLVEGAVAWVLGFGMLALTVRWVGSRD